MIKKSGQLCSVGLGRAAHGQDAIILHQSGILMSPGVSEAFEQVLLDPVFRSHDNDGHRRFPNQKLAEISKRRRSEHLLQCADLLSARSDREALRPLSLIHI